MAARPDSNPNSNPGFGSQSIPPEGSAEFSQIIYTDGGEVEIIRTELSPNQPRGFWHHTRRGHIKGWTDLTLGLVGAGAATAIVATASPEARDAFWEDITKLFGRDERSLVQGDIAELRSEYGLKVISHPNVGHADRLRPQQLDLLLDIVEALPDYMVPGNKTYYGVLPEPMEVWWLGRDTNASEFVTETPNPPDDYSLTLSQSILAPNNRVESLSRVSMRLMRLSMGSPRTQDSYMLGINGKWADWGNSVVAKVAQGEDDIETVDIGGIDIGLDNQQITVNAWRMPVGDLLQIQNTLANTVRTTAQQEEFLFNEATLSAMRVPPNQENPTIGVIDGPMLIALLAYAYPRGKNFFFRNFQRLLPKEQQKKVAILYDYAQKQMFRGKSYSGRF